MPRNTAALLIEAQASIHGLDHKIDEIQVQLDQFPALEAEIAGDRARTPADIRAGLSNLGDRASDLSVTQKRLAEGPGKDFIQGFHALRMTYITRLQRAGVSPREAMELARHSVICA